jgi:hypothetical protein
VDETRKQVGFEPSERICSNRCPKSIAFGSRGLNKLNRLWVLAWHESYVIEKCDMLLICSTTGVCSALVSPDVASWAWTGPQVCSPHRHTRFLKKKSGILSSSFTLAPPHRSPFCICPSSASVRVCTSVAVVRIRMSIERRR